ncbi:hypothetical protein J1605_004713 [Eschrichtius robustus]|uniref:Uncharacterized protein n=1 Tax=Eschrichtius robustus TaxID=9764 RepID=A0AB34HGV8_ESCRO|nr:hypothetical protein J1605_004713 [Eschrichtius robustus]
MGRGSGWTQAKRWSKWAEERLERSPWRPSGLCELASPWAVGRGWWRPAGRPSGHARALREAAGGPLAAGGSCEPPEWAVPAAPPRRRRARSRSPVGRCRRAGGARAGRGLRVQGTFVTLVADKAAFCLPGSSHGGDLACKEVRLAAQGRSGSPRGGLLLPGWKRTLRPGLCACVLSGARARS